MTLLIPSAFFMNFHQGLICSVVVEFSPNLRASALSSFFFLCKEFFFPL